MLVVGLYRPVIYKLKPLGRGNWNIINQWGEATKMGNQILKFQWREAKWVRSTVFDSNLVGESLRGN